MDDDCTAFASNATRVSREAIREAWDWVNEWDIADNAYGRNMMEAMRLALTQERQFLPSDGGDGFYFACLSAPH